MSRLLLSFVLVPLMAIASVGYGQQASKPKAFIEQNNEAEGWFNQYLDKANTWAVVGSLVESNVIFRLQVSQGAFRAKAKLFILDAQTEETIWASETENGQSSAFNGYSPKKNAIKKLVDHLETDFDKGKINLSHFGANRGAGVAAERKSTADELLKLKGLFDSGAITKEEYDGLKKKLLEQ